MLTPFEDILTLAECLVRQVLEYLVPVLLGQLLVLEELDLADEHSKQLQLDWATLFVLLPQHLLVQLFRGQLSERKAAYQLKLEVPFLAEDLGGLRFRVGDCFVLLNSLGIAALLFLSIHLNNKKNLNGRSSFRSYRRSSMWNN